MIKGHILPDHIQTNKYVLLVAGMPPLVCTSVTGLEQELDTIDLPDRTPQTGGRTKPVEFEIKLPLHHRVERVAMELWFRECQDPVTPTHKKLATLIYQSQTRIQSVSYSLIGMFVFKRGLPDGELDSDGDMAEITWGCKASDLISLG